MDVRNDLLTEERGGPNQGQMTVHGARQVSGTMTVPGDKSISHRSVILGGMAEGTSRITGFLPSDDCLNTLKAFRNLGVQVQQQAPSTILLESPGFSGLREPTDVLDFGNSGTAVRLMCGVLAGTHFFSVLTGDGSLRTRPMARVTDPLRKMGARIDGPEQGKRLPLALRGTSLSGIVHLNTHKSAQVKSAILLAGLNAGGPCTVDEPVATRDHTERMIPVFGGTIHRDGRAATVHPGKLRGSDLHVPGDFSSAAFFLVLALITPGSRITINEVGLNPTRTALLPILNAMGARSIQVNSDTAPDDSGEPYGSLSVEFSELTGIDVPPEWIPNAIDEIPILAAAAACAHGTTRIRGAAELRVKESDRIRGICEALSAVGITVEEFPDGLSIQGKGPEPRIKGAQVQSRNDHRIAMSMAILGSRLPSGEKISIVGTDYISTSFPGFRERFNQVVS
ncbi:MAG: 3-phosphoshikimate 1-carboxyvinyltransferase [Leptospirales bacterium]